MIPTICRIDIPTIHRLRIEFDRRSDGRRGFHEVESTRPISLALETDYVNRHGGDNHTIKYLERVRKLWPHGDTCEYRSQGGVVEQ